MMVLGIPPYRLRRDLLDAEIRAILAMGVELRTGVRLGEDFSLSSLKADGFEAVFVAVGATRSRELQIPGVELDGVLKAIDFLLNVNLGYHVDLGDDVVVVGGGNVALDAARSALREIAAGTAGSFDAGHMAEAEAVGAVATATLDVARTADAAGRPARALRDAREPGRDAGERVRDRGGGGRGDRAPPPARPEARSSGPSASRASRRWRWPRSSTRTAGSTRRWSTGTEDTIACDSVVLAVGQTADLSWLEPADGVEVTPRNTLVVDRETLATTAPGVYSGGDLAFGPRNLIDAIADGRRAAASIHRQLTGRGGAATVARGPDDAADRLGHARAEAGGVHGALAAAGAVRADRPADRLARGRARLHRRGGSAGGRPVPPVLPEHHARAVALHPVRRLRRRLSRALHPDRADRRHRRARAPSAPRAC